MKKTEQHWAIEYSSSRDSWLCSRICRTRSEAISYFCWHWQREVDLDASYSLATFSNDAELRGKFWRRMKASKHKKIRAVKVTVTWQDSP